ncbi:DUF4371 domain-containing protein [Aphis craccivora]|uniref:DUF4371 domain-containing protein n=1 Tax=Aphis craccivora TaxID=307492 RepID=A0A6G0YA00_APHCR|nr:DUF4371 domain-containing protein [Aphis craccivora]
MPKADIPLAKLQNSYLKSFLEKYSAHLVPDESILRKHYIQLIYNETLVSIRNSIGDGPIWVSIDETIDVDSRFIANIIIGKLDDNKSKPFLLNCEKLDKCNHQTIAQFFNNSMNILWPDVVLHDNVLLFVSDAAPYIVKADVITKLETRDLTLVDSLNIVEETVKKLEKVQGKIGEIINTKVKKIFLLVILLKFHWMDVELTPSDIAKMQYCPITSVEVERSFSRYKAILRPNRRSFELENLKMHHTCW